MKCVKCPYCDICIRFLQEKIRGKFMAVYVLTGEHITDEEVNLQDAIEQYAKSQNLVIDQEFQDAQSTKLDWDKRCIGKLINSKATAGDSIVVYEAAGVARSTCQMLEILMVAADAHIHIHFVKYGQHFVAQERNRLADMLDLVQNIESGFISRRTTDALARRRAAGLPLGRPKGRKNKSLKLDKHRKDIMKYLRLGISKASILMSPSGI
jgi:DNA invertase Pin-like site-specific DNA recombinase